MQIFRLAFVFALVFVFCIVNVVLSSKAQSKKCQQYGHSCLGGHGKRSSDMAKPTYTSQLASDESETQFDYDDVPTNIIPNGYTNSNTNQITNNGQNIGAYDRLPIIETNRYPLWFVQRFQKRQRTINSDSYPTGVLQQQQQQQQQQPKQQPTSTHYNHKFTDIDQIYPVRVKGSVGQFSITDQIQFPL